jgi:hypothetical protein
MAPFSGATTVVTRKAAVMIVVTIVGTIVGTTEEVVMIAGMTGGAAMIGGTMVGGTIEDTIGMIVSYRCFCS